MFRRFLLGLSAWALNQLYDQRGLKEHYRRCFVEAVESELFGRGEVLGLIQIWPDDDELDIFSREECASFSEIEGLDP